MSEEKGPEKTAAEISEEGLRRVGAVAQLTGLSTHTLRAWERRYAAIHPSRTESGLRLYSEQDLARLQLLKALTERGEPISMIAGLETSQLRERLVTHHKNHVDQKEPQPDALPLRNLGLVNRNLTQQIQSNPSELLPLEVAADKDSVRSLLEIDSDIKIDALLIEMEALGDNPFETLARCRERFGEIPIWTSYTFANQSQLDQAVDAGAHLVRLPLRVAALRDHIGGFTSSLRGQQIQMGLSELETRPPQDFSAPAPERRFTDTQLARLREMSNSVACECPRHLSDLIVSLLGFEEYSRRCVNLQPADAALHELLERGTGIARSLMEELLERLRHEDNLTL
jgi:DNA-binding transcriptional MerR regulator